MLIVSHKDTYVAPHRHYTKSETLLVLEGAATALLFDEDGAAERALHMSPKGSAGCFFYRMPPKRYHGLIIRSEYLVFLESTKGPFRPEDSQHAPWAPAPHEASAGQEFYAAIDRMIAEDRLRLER